MRIPESKQPVLPPSDDFAAYLTSPYHQHRMNEARRAMLKRMRNFHATEVYPAISEALGVISALGDFYGGGADTRDLAGRVCGDPLPGRANIAIEPDGSRIELPTGKVLQPMQARMVAILSRGEPIELSALSEQVGSKARHKTVVGSAIRSLRVTLSGTGIEIRVDEHGRVLMDASSCILARAILGAA